MIAGAWVTPTDMALRGGAAVLLLFLAGLLLRDHGRAVAARLGAAFAVGAAAYALCSAAGFHALMGVWAAPILALATGNNLVFWLFAKALFDDGFRPRAWHLAAWLGLVGLAPLAGLAPALRTVLTVATLGFAVLAAAQTMGSWRTDLIEPRRRLRLTIIIAVAGYTVLTALANLLGLGSADHPDASLVEAVGLALIAGGAAWSLLRVSGGAALFPRAEAAPAKAAAAIAEPDAQDAAALAALDRLMTHDRAYRQDRLTIGGLAQRLGMPEYRLRRLINQGLGERNFNAFLNRYRTGEAMAALEDPEQLGVPVLTIALDAGFSSLGPFNRAFKATTGKTPSAWRREALERAALANSQSDSRIRKSA